MEIKKGSLTDEQVAKVQHLKLTNVVLSFPDALFVAKATAGSDGAPGKPRFGCTFLLDPEDPAHAKQIADIEKRIKILAMNEFGRVPPDLKLFFKDGDLKEYEGYPGHMYVSANSPGDKPGPKVVDRNPKVILEPDTDKIYGGVVVNGLLSLWVQDGVKNPTWGKGIYAQLKLVQYVEHGEAFGAAQPDPEEEFEDLGEEELGMFDEEEEGADDLGGLLD
jgi:hypothetical protein